MERQYPGSLKSLREEFMGSLVRKSDAAEDLEDENYDEDEDKDFKQVKPSDKEGRWNKHGDPNGTVKMSKAKDEEEEEPKKQKKGTPSEEDENEEEQEEEYEEEEKEVEKGRADREPENFGPGSMHKRAKRALDIRNGKTKPASYDAKNDLPRVAATIGKLRSAERQYKSLRREFEEDSAMEGMRNLHKGDIKKGDEDEASELFDPSTVTKGEQMVENETEIEDVEYVTKALVPIEEIDTIVKARTEEISKAYVTQIDEIKKAYDAKFAEFTAKIEKMEQETIRKGGSVVVIPELLGNDGGMLSNADAIARMQAGK